MVGSLEKLAMVYTIRKRVNNMEDSRNYKQLNKQRLIDIQNSENGISHGLGMLIGELRKYMAGDRDIVKIYFMYVTNIRLSAHIVINNDLYRLVIPEAGHKMHKHYKDGYQANGHGYSKPDHILEAMLHAVIKEWRAMVIPSINKLRDMTKAETIFLGLRS